MTDVLLRSSTQPGVVGLSFGRHLALVVDGQGHLVGGVHHSVQAAPPQQDVGATVYQGERLGAHVERQARGRVHVVEAVTGAPLPQLGPAVWVTRGQTQARGDSRVQAIPSGRVLDSEGIFVCVQVKSRSGLL